MRRNAGLTNGLIVSEAVMMRLSKVMGRHHGIILLYEAAQRRSRRHPVSARHQEHPSCRNGTMAALDGALAVEDYTGDPASRR